MHAAHTDQELSSPQLLHRVNALRRTDNITNWFYLAREYLFLGTVIGLTIVFYHYRSQAQIAWLWNVPVTLLAVALIGAGQHRLITLGHEASHYLLFRNRLLNELASDWFCMFPVLSVTHNYRLQHLAHHQYVNDPERDPDLAFMLNSGHEVQFPMSRWRVLWECLIKQFLWIPGLIRYVRLRARHSTAGGGSGPYAVQGERSRLLIGVGAGYLVALVMITNALGLLGGPWLRALVPAGMWAAVITFYALLPERLYPHSRVKPVVTPRWWTFQRLTFLTLLFTGLAWLTHCTGEFWGLYYLLLWVVPLLTTFAFFMILREEVQHGGAGRERFTHSRLFRGSRLVRFAVFPLGMDYHLPHHLFPLVPHYRLRKLHALLEENQTYRQHAVTLEGPLFQVPAASVLVDPPAAPQRVPMRLGLPRKPARPSSLKSIKKTRPDRREDHLPKQKATK
jgi:fatty acid desaturase